jgi:RNA polymerase sigma-70 factor (ECF subfamily)
MTPKEQMEFTYEANLPLLRRLAILLLAFSDSDEGDLEDQFEIITASEDDLYDQEASGNDRKSDEEIEREAEEILSTTGNSILRLALSYLHNIEDAEDILQETMIKFVTVRPVFESEAHRKAWLMRVASNLAKNRIDYNRVRDTLELNEEIAGEVQEDLDKGDEYKAIWDAVRSLPVHQREAIHLFYQEGYSTAEIAQITGRREATVRSDLKRARDRLREMLKEASDFE